MAVMVLDRFNGTNNPEDWISRAEQYWLLRGILATSSFLLSRCTPNYMGLSPTIIQEVPVEDATTASATTMISKKIASSLGYENSSIVNNFEVFGESSHQIKNSVYQFDTSFDLVLDTSDELQLALQVTHVISKPTWCGEPELDCSDDTQSRKSTSEGDESLSTNTSVVFDGGVKREAPLIPYVDDALIVEFFPSITTQPSLADFGDLSKYEIMKDGLPTCYWFDTGQYLSLSIFLVFQHIKCGGLLYVLEFRNIGDHCATFEAQDDGVIGHDTTLLSEDAHRKYMCEHVLVGSSYSVWKIFLFCGTWFQLLGLVAARRYFKSSSGTRTSDLKRRNQQTKQLANKDFDQVVPCKALISCMQEFDLLFRCAFELLCTSLVHQMLPSLSILSHVPCSFHGHICDGVYDRVVWEHNHIESNVLPSHVGTLQCLHPESEKIMQIDSTLYEAIRANAVVVAGYKTLFMELFCRILLRRFLRYQSSAARSVKNSRHVRKFFVYVEPWAFDNAIVSVRL
ncbi:hypothetical protein CQW23_06360 [Capsicum baccatum]|uniref:Uncharacterized protein n=1 Tax=Capsicum baccatum TaxID=33114 RepID=A0A2G2X337_CAPBA|nr:hypothetical protein CQW23_06360 [Capsicum baccatum]